MPDGCDPDDIIQNQGAGEMKRILNKSVSLPDYLWSLGNAKISVNTPEQLAKLESILLISLFQLLIKIYRQIIDLGLII